MEAAFWRTGIYFCKNERSFNEVYGLREEPRKKNI
jgi:hypothetical protein